MTAKFLLPRKTHATFSFMKATTHFRSAIYLRPGRLDERLAEELQAAQIKPTKPAMAAHLGVDYMTYWRTTRNPKHKPAQEFIAAIIKHFGEDALADLCEVRDLESAA